MNERDLSRLKDDSPMSVRIPKVQAWMLLILLCACAGRFGARSPCFAQSCPSIEAYPIVERGPIEPVVSSLPSFDVLESISGRNLEMVYHALTPLEAQCMAAANSSLGNALSHERRAVQPARPFCHRDDCSTALMQRVLAYASAEARNKSAGDALNVYYHLAEAEGKRDLLATSTAQIALANKELDQIVQRGLTIPSGAEELRMRQLDINNQVVEDELAITTLNSKLRQLVHAQQTDEQVRFWPVMQLTVTNDPIDMEEEVAQGLAMRPELNLLRFVENRLNVKTLPAVRQMLGGVNAMLGSSPDSKCCGSLVKIVTLLCGSGKAQDEVDARRRQIRAYRMNREHEVAEEIRQAIHTIQARVQQVALGNQRLQMAQEQLRESQGRQQSGRASFFDVTVDQLTVSQGRGELLTGAVNWEIARVQLRQAQGLLVQDCTGYCP